MATNIALSAGQKLTGALNSSQSTSQLVRTSTGTLYAFLVVNGRVQAYKSTNNGSSWSLQFSTNEPQTNGTVVSAAIDSTDLIHVAYGYTNGATTTAFWASYTPSTDTFSLPQQAGNASGSVSSIAIAVDTNNAPHITWSAAGIGRYTNRVNGQWYFNTLSLAASGGANVDILIDQDNVPQISYVTGTNIVAAIGNKNNPSSFTTSNIATNATTATTASGTSMALDSSFTTWVAYQAANGGNIMLTNRVSTATWSFLASSLGITSNSGYPGKNPSIAIDGNDIYIFYERSAGGLAYNRYNSVSGTWLGEQIIQANTSKMGTAKAWHNPFVKWSNYFDNGLTGANNKDQNYIEYLFDDGSTVYYDRVNTAQIATGLAQISFQTPSSGTTTSTSSSTSVSTSTSSTSSSTSISTSSTSSSTSISTSSTSTSTSISTSTSSTSSSTSTSISTSTSSTSSSTSISTSSTSSSTSTSSTSSSTSISTSSTSSSTSTSISTSTSSTSSSTSISTSSTSSSTSTSSTSSSTSTSISTSSTSSSTSTSTSISTSSTSSSTSISTSSTSSSTSISSTSSSTSQSTSTSSTSSSTSHSTSTSISSTSSSTSISTSSTSSSTSISTSSTSSSTSISSTSTSTTVSLTTSTSSTSSSTSTSQSTSTSVSSTSSSTSTSISTSTSSTSTSTSISTSSTSSSTSTSVSTSSTSSSTSHSTSTSSTSQSTSTSISTSSTSTSISTSTSSTSTSTSVSFTTSTSSTSTSMSSTSTSTTTLPLPDINFQPRSFIRPDAGKGFIKAQSIRSFIRRRIK